MPEFTPVNNVELQLRAVLRDKNTPLWNLYTPLASSPLWVITRHYPELDGSDLFAPAGQNPDVLTFTDKNGRWIGLYTSPERAEIAFVRWEIPRRDWTVISAPGYQLLKLLKDVDAELCLNLGCDGIQKTLDADMVEILIERGEPEYEQRATAPQADFAPTGKPEQYLGPLREFLSQAPSVRAAWVLTRRDPAAKDQNKENYEIELLMRDPDDDSLLDKVITIAKAVTPVEMEWTAGVMMADENSLRNLARKHPPFYCSEDFRPAVQSPI
ncbi:MAG: enhanced serine sensitivity protein SseB C-terminal domain-containing protein [Chthoniobacterales bacterium]